MAAVVGGDVTRGKRAFCPESVKMKNRVKGNHSLEPFPSLAAESFTGTQSVDAFPHCDNKA